MYRPPSDARDPSGRIDPTWTDVLASYVAIALVPLALWIVSQPARGVVAIAVLAGAYVGLRRTATLVRCLYDCGGFALALGDSLQICVVRPGHDGVNCRAGCE